MRAALDEAVSKIPMDQVTPAIKAQMAEFILKAAAEGQTGYQELLNTALAQIQAVLSMLT
jgi:N-acetylglucosamine kinase-like BadF-type ATPase